MSARNWALGLVCSLVGMTAGLTAGCSSSAKPTAVVDTHSDDPESDAGTKVVPGITDEEPEEVAQDAGSPQSAQSPVEKCIASPIDDPDDNFTDSNCDGIDGDKSKAIFVATTGSDTADGSMEHPVATFTHGIELAIAKGKDVYVCKGDYPENTIQLNTKGVRVYGAYDCTANWVRNSQSQAHLISTANTALNIKNVSDSIVFDRVDIASANGNAGSESSIAVFISNSKNVTLRRGTLQAGSGADATQPTAAPAAQNSIPACAGYVYSTGQCFGEPGVDVYQYKNCFYTGLTLSSAPFTDPSYFSLAPDSKVTATNQCKGAISSYGGPGGGTLVANRSNGTNGAAGSPPSTTGDLHGADGPDGSNGSAANQGIGTLGADGYVASNLGTAGTDGTMGQAGTGGSGGGFTVVYDSGASEFQVFYYAPRAGGGKGGWAGCPGDGGAAGNAGGASIAVAVFQSQVNLERVTLATANGGKGSEGGLGGQGAAGQPGGAPGTAYYQCPQCLSGQEIACAHVNKTNVTSAEAGGHGGKGGNGAQGGPGGGGPSSPLLASGNAPSLSLVTFLPGSGGPGGSNNGGPRATDGESTDQKVLP